MNYNYEKLNARLILHIHRLQSKRKKERKKKRATTVIVTRPGKTTVYMHIHDH